ncbi:hypothetical protein HY989_05850 [Candidatus Micrarchaeota archaeon]|nr:hypothetical protein [Candidatus Micrarchaeota archaeon]
MPIKSNLDLRIEVLPTEDPDWGFARNKRSLQRTQFSEFSQGVYSASLNQLAIPNRDYSYEGLFGIFDSENWKFLDGMAFGIKANGAIFNLIPKNVEIFPWKAIYNYSIENTSQEFSATFYLLKETNFPVLSVKFAFSGELPNPEIIIEPLIDIRHMYLQSSALGHKTTLHPTHIEISRDSKSISFLTKNPFSFNQHPHSQHWNYKLGVGDRQIRGERVVFCEESRELFCPGTIVLIPKKNSAELQANCHIAGKKPKFELSLHDEKKAISKAKKIIKTYSGKISKFASGDESKSLALKGRLIALLENFSLNCGNTNAPDAGAYWFRNIWFRDAFQGIHDNFELFYSNKKMPIRSLIIKALDLQKNGLIPNKLSEKKEDSPSYNALDSTLLCFLCGLKYLKKSPDKKLQLALKNGVKAFFQSLEAGPILLDNYLLKCPANYSWVDSERKEMHFGSEFLIPNRIPLPWVLDLVAKSNSKESLQENLNSSKYFLIETNALWILFLREFSDIFPSKEFVHSSSNAELTFKSLFFSKNPCHIVNEAFEKASELSSTSIYSAALLSTIFTNEEISGLIANFEPCLVYKGNLLFGVLATNNSRRIFLGDDQYHSAVIWPRDSLPLHQLLKTVDDPRANELLDSLLLHQMDEGAIFYNHELFSLPEGNNPCASAKELSPVPVRNPAQFWSQWTQAFLEK